MPKNHEVSIKSLRDNVDWRCRQPTHELLDGILTDAAKRGSQLLNPLQENQHLATGTIGLDTVKDFLALDPKSTEGEAFQDTLTSIAIEKYLRETAQETLKVQEPRDYMQTIAEARYTRGFVHFMRLAKEFEYADKSNSHPFAIAKNNNALGGLVTLEHEVETGVFGKKAKGKRVEKFSEMLLLLEYVAQSLDFNMSLDMRLEIAAAAIGFVQSYFSYKIEKKEKRRNVRDLVLDHALILFDHYGHGDIKSYLETQKAACIFIDEDLIRQQVSLDDAATYFERINGQLQPIST
ncbi:hypothetical protein C4579_02525 [Candidatus Microgenomates bacterium]|nr:MAG: hypothetical protein C4579_02525 [Candidatus Microgenomates bacterium]